MIPNLALVVSAYIAVRLITIALRQFPEFEKKASARFGIAALAVFSLVVVVVVTADTIEKGRTKLSGFSP